MVKPGLMPFKKAQPIPMPVEEIKQATTSENSYQKQVIVPTKPVVAEPSQTPASNAELKSLPAVELPKLKAGVTLGGIKDIKEAARQKLMAQQGAKVKIEITQEKLNDAWRELVAIVANGKALYKSAIEASELHFTSHEVIIHANVVALDFLKNERQTLLDFFKRTFCNEEINVLFELLPEKAGDPGVKVLSSKEVYEKMVQKNPLLADLRATLGLDIEY